MKSIKTLIIIISIIIIGILIYRLTEKSEMNAQIKQSIDSLTVVNKKLLESQENIDKSISAYEYKINKIDSQVNNIENKTVTINRYYTTIGQQVDKYTPSEIDSFFKKRYNY